MSDSKGYYCGTPVCHRCNDTITPGTMNARNCTLTGDGWTCGMCVDASAITLVPGDRVRVVGSNAALPIGSLGKVREIDNARPVFVQPDGDDFRHFPPRFHAHELERIVESA